MDCQNLSTIYAIQCTKNGKVYVGCTQNFKVRIRTHFAELKKGWKSHSISYGKREKSEWQNDFDRYGRDAFKVYILENNVSPVEAPEREIYWIKYYDATNPKNGYNTVEGSAHIDLFPVEKGIPKKREETE